MRELWPFLKLFRRHALRMAFGALLMLVTLLAGIGLLGVSGWFITGSALAGLGLLGGAAFNIFTPSAAIRAAALIRTGGRYAERLVNHEATFRLLADLRRWLFARAIPLDAGQIARLTGGDLLTRLTADIDALDNLYLRVVAPSMVAVIAAIAVLVPLGWIDPAVALTTAALMLVSGLLVPALAARLGAGAGADMVGIGARLRSHAVDGVQGLADLRAFAAEARQGAAIAQETDGLIARQRRMSSITGLSSALSLMAAGGAVWLALFLTTGQAGEDRLDGPLIALVVFLVMALFEATAPLPLAYQFLGRTKAAARRLTEIADMQPRVGDPEHPVPVPDRHDLMFDGISFGYGKPVLDDLRLHLPEGRTAVLLGPSGSGKSTLAQLALRLIDPDTGSVTLGGVDLRSLRQEDLHSRIAYVSQNTHLFAADIRDNLLIARPGATNDELWDALETVDLADFVESLPNGILTWVGENGVLLSGGQARRLSLARALLKDAPVMILDEPTEGLDTATEAVVMQALRPKMAGRTVLLITHRESLVTSSDLVWRMEEV
ncbi:cysteine/glutathione ABC transporter ATP-binding protein/permease CydC [Skermanella aerolata]|uniref:Cysteine/glutathione ABC transporter ATP-binding protein/permease CydC n=1 Tax=Skermanella aerolata TaxID=393310 RepID=A0A512DQT7_9PROT|nr:thiol reductant ABC exporter subunit CydC [Skermanella aerolata]GEO38796.1 cysteine/glutathione ABC transporter ATP-binding protein/permease CydC [Skermanella aerolata]